MQRFAGGFLCAQVEPNASKHIGRFTIQRDNNAEAHNRISLKRVGGESSSADLNPIELHSTFLEQTKGGERPQKKAKAEKVCAVEKVD